MLGPVIAGGDEARIGGAVAGRYLIMMFCIGRLCCRNILSCGLVRSYN